MCGLDQCVLTTDHSCDVVRFNTIVTIYVTIYKCHIIAQSKHTYTHRTIVMLHDCCNVAQMTIVNNSLSIVLEQQGVSWSLT